MSTIVWSQQKSGSCTAGRCWQVFEQKLGGEPEQITSDDHNHYYPAIANNGDIVYLKDGEGAGPGLQVVELVSGVENVIEFSSGSPPGCTEPPAGPPTCNSWRAAGQHFGIGDGKGQNISYHDFCDPSCTRTFDVSAVGAFSGLPPTANYPDINAKGDIAYFDGLGSVYKTNLTTPSPILVAKEASLPRINDVGDVVLISRGQMLVFVAPQYKASSVASKTGLWADINNSGYIVFEAADASGYHQIYKTIAVPTSEQSSPFSWCPFEGCTHTDPSILLFRARLQPTNIDFSGRKVTESTPTKSFDEDSCYFGKEDKYGPWRNVTGGGGTVISGDLYYDQVGWRENVVNYYILYRETHSLPFPCGARVKQEIKITPPSGDPIVVTNVLTADIYEDKLVNGRCLEEDYDGSSCPADQTSSRSWPP
jgi:hypothetical protein